MKRLLAAMICLVVLSFAALPVDAQTRNRRSNSAAQTSRHDDRYRYDDRSIWEKHRDKITTAGGAAAGAVIGGVAGGKKGALIGAIAGGGGAALYTYKIRKKDDDWRYR